MNHFAPHFRQQSHSIQNGNTSQISNLECRFGATFEKRSRNVGVHCQKDLLPVFQRFRRATFLPIFRNNVAPVTTGAFLKSTTKNADMRQHSRHLLAMLEAAARMIYFKCPLFPVNHPSSYFRQQSHPLHNGNISQINNLECCVGVTFEKCSRNGEIATKRIHFPPANVFGEPLFFTFRATT